MHIQHYSTLYKLENSKTSLKNNVANKQISEYVKMVI